MSETGSTGAAGRLPDAARPAVAVGQHGSLKGWAKPVAEPEICVRMASDLPGDATGDAAIAAVKEITPAIELADLDPAPTPDNLDVVLADDIFQRHVLLCGNTRFGGATSGLTVAPNPARHRGRPARPIRRRSPAS